MYKYMVPVVLAGLAFFFSSQEKQPEIYASVPTAYLKRGDFILWKIEGSVSIGFSDSCDYQIKDCVDKKTMAVITISRLNDMIDCSIVANIEIVIRRLGEAPYILDADTTWKLRKGDQIEIDNEEFIFEI